MELLHQVLQLSGRGPGPGPDDVVVLPVQRLLDRQRVRRAAHPLRRGDSLGGLGLAEKSQREVDVFGAHRLAAGLLAQLFGPVFERPRGCGWRPEGKEQPHSEARCFLVSAASARSVGSDDFSSSAAISSCSRRPRFCDSFLFVSTAATGMRKLTMAPSIRCTYSSRSASNCGSHCASRDSMRRRWDARFTSFSEIISGIPYACTAA